MAHTKKIYHFTIDRTDRYFFDIEAKNSEEAWDKFDKLDIEDADSKKNIDISSELVKVEEIFEDEDDDS